jgi:transposase-like protein
MSARDRRSVEPSDSSDSQLTYSRFLELFPDNDACLDYLKQRSYPDGSNCPGCGKATKYHRIKKRAAYSCQFCGRQVYPTAGTIFHKSTTSLQLWFWAIFLMSSTRCGISAKQLEREIGVTYKTAHRMFKQIRSLLAEDDGPLSGEVEIDESGFGGKPRAGEIHNRQEAGFWAAQKKTTVFAAVERRGRIRAMVVPDRKQPTLQAKVRQHVLPESIIFSDEWPLYIGIGREYRGHHRIKHQQKIYVQGNVPHPDHRRVLRPGEERHPRRPPRGQRPLLAELPGRIQLPLQPPQERAEPAAYVLGDPGSRLEGSTGRSLTGWTRLETFSRSFRKSVSE